MQVSRESPRHRRYEGYKLLRLRFSLVPSSFSRCSPLHLFARRDAMHFSLFSSFARRFFPRKGATPSTRRMRNANTSDRLRELHRLGFFYENLCLRSILLKHSCIPYRFSYLRLFMCTIRNMNEHINDQI